MNFRAASDRLAAGLAMGALAASTLGSGAYEETGTGCLQPVPGCLVKAALATGRLSLDDLGEGRLAVLDHVQAVIGERRVAVLVERVLTKHALTVLGLVYELLGHRSPVIRLVPGGLQGVESELHRLVAVDGVGVRVLVVVLLVEVREELLCLRVVALLELLEPESRNRDLGALGHVGGDAALLGVRERLLGHSVRPVELRALVRSGHVLE